jgi:hypothetical protein
LETSAEEESMMGVSVMGTPVYVKMCRCWSCLDMWLWLSFGGGLVVDEAEQDGVNEREIQTDKTDGWMDGWMDEVR